MKTAKYLNRDGLPRLTYDRLDAAGAGAALPTLLFCGGFRSDKEGTKALFLEESCWTRGQAFVRFDYSGHGASSGDFNDGTIGSWTGDTLAVLDALTEGPVIIAGSSMGGWIAFLVALQRPERVRGIVGIAAAPDFTRDIFEEHFDDAARALLARQGYVDVPSTYSPQPYRITKALIDDGERQCLLDGPIPLDIPVCLLQGMQDADVPWQKAFRIKNALPAGALVEVVLFENGDHRLSKPEELAMLDRKVQEINASAAR